MLSAANSVNLLDQILKNFQDLFTGSSSSSEQNGKEIECISNDMFILSENIREISKRENILVNLLCIERDKTDFLRKELEVAKKRFDSESNASVLKEVEMLVAEGRTCSCVGEAHGRLDTADIDVDVLETSLLLQETSLLDEDDVLTAISYLDQNMFFSNKIEDFVEEASIACYNSFAPSEKEEIEIVDKKELEIIPKSD